MLKYAENLNKVNEMYKNGEISLLKKIQMEDYIKDYNEIDMLQNSVGNYLDTMKKTWER
jgi:hypothetical protein